jgi:hypothetical protein
MMKLTHLLAASFLLLTSMPLSWADNEPVPRYKPSSRSPEPLDIRDNVYGASRNAPKALGIGTRIADFRVPRAGGGFVSLREARSQGPVAIIFYRGHW